MKIIKLASGKSRVISKDERSLLSLLSLKNELIDAVDNFINQKDNIVQILFVIKNVAANESNKGIYDAVTKAINEPNFSDKMTYINEIYGGIDDFYDNDTDEEPIEEQSMIDLMRGIKGRSDDILKNR